MAKPFNIREARALLVELIDAAHQGDEILIGRRGIAEIRLVPIDEAEASRLIAARK